MKRLRKRDVLVFALAFLILSPMLVCIASHFIGQYALWQHAQPLFDYPLPPQTEILERHFEYTSTGGNSDCVSHVWMVVATSLSTDELNDYYQTDLAEQSLRLPLIGATVERQLPDGRSLAVIESYGGIEGRNYSLLCGW